MTSEIEKDIRIFIDETINYLKKYLQSRVEIGSPYPVTGALQLFDFTGLIGISGERKGCLYVSATRELTGEIARKFLGQDDIPEEMYLAVVGEVANSIGGNAQKSSAKVFNISVPVLFEGPIKQLKYQGEFPIFAVPFRAGDDKGILVIGMTDG